MWLAVDAAGPGLSAWPVAADGAAGPERRADDLRGLVADLATPPARIVVDGGARAYDIALPAPLTALARDDAWDGLQTLQLARPAGLARLLGAQRLAPAAQQRPWHACLCRADGQTIWAHGGDGKLLRWTASPVEERLHDLLRGDALRAAGAGDGDDDVGFERGLSLTESDGGLDADLARVLRDAESGRLRGEAVGANLAGVLVGHDAAMGLRLGRLGSPVAVIGEGLTAQRYAIALGRFGVAVRRLDPLRALIAGGGWLATNDGSAST